MRYYIKKKTVISAVVIFIILFITSIISMLYTIKSGIKTIEKDIQLQGMTELVDSLKGQTEYQKSVIMDLEEALIKSKEV